MLAHVAEAHGPDLVAVHVVGTGSGCGEGVSFRNRERLHNEGIPAPERARSSRIRIGTFHKGVREDEAETEDADDYANDLHGALRPCCPVDGPGCNGDLPECSSD